jgi:hypothetical protein
MVLFIGDTVIYITTLTENVSISFVNMDNIASWEPRISLKESNEAFYNFLIFWMKIEWSHNYMFSIMFKLNLIKFVVIKISLNKHSKIRIHFVSF